MADDLTTRLIKDREGFSSRAYWDVNAWRVGYGSDTTTAEDGTVQKVTKNTKTTRSSAARDLVRRIPEFQRDGVIAFVGQDAWDKLGEGAQAAVTSLAYNYGGLKGLPSLQRAIKTGDNKVIAETILKRASDNGGVNAARRQAEASLVLGHPVPLGTVGNGSGDIGDLQQQLSQRGFDPGPVDGINGPRTKAAIKEFQKANGLVVDGIVGPRTREALARTSQSNMPDAAAFGDTSPKALGITTRLNTEDPTRSDIRQLIPHDDYEAARTLGASGIDPRLTALGLPAPSLTAQGGAGGGALAGGLTALSGPSTAPTVFPRPLAAPAPPTPQPRPTGQPVQSGGSASPAPSQGTVRLASGKMVAPGSYRGSDGRMLTITDDGSGNAVITHPSSGLIDFAHEATSPTIVGGMIRSKVPEMAAEGYDAVKARVGDAAGNIGATASNAVAGLQSLGSNIGQGFQSLGNMFGQPRTGVGTDLSTLPPINATGGVRAGTGAVGRGALIMTPKPVVATPAIRVPAVSASPPSSGVTLKGGKSGRTYTEGRVYSNKNGTFIATAGPGGVARFQPVISSGTGSSSSSGNAGSTAYTRFMDGGSNSNDSSIFG